MTWTLGTRDGSTLKWDDGAVVSCNPPLGALTHVPAVAGEYEVFQFNGTSMNCSPRPGEVYVYGFQPTVANRPGMCAFTLETL